MFLMFGPHRPDILPLGDPALRKSIQRLYGLKQNAHDGVYRAVAGPWRPYRTVAGRWPRKNQAPRAAGGARHAPVISAFFRTSRPC